MASQRDSTQHKWLEQVWLRKRRQWVNEGSHRDLCRKALQTTNTSAWLSCSARLDVGNLVRAHHPPTWTTTTAAAAAALGGGSAPMYFINWAITRRRRNTLMHMLHGNGGSVTQRRHQAGEARQLQELREAGRLRADGWQLPTEVPDAYLMRVYDTRIPRDWLLELAADVRRIDDPNQVLIVGGDFASKADLTDSDVAKYPVAAAWSEQARHIVIPPRPHLGEWVAGKVRPGEPGLGDLLGCCRRPQQVPPGAEGADPTPASWRRSAAI